MFPVQYVGYYTHYDVENTQEHCSWHCSVWLGEHEIREFFFFDFEELKDILGKRYPGIKLESIDNP